MCLKAHIRVRAQTHAIVVVGSHATLTTFKGWIFCSYQNFMGCWALYTTRTGLFLHGIKSWNRQKHNIVCLKGIKDKWMKIINIPQSSIHKLSRPKTKNILKQFDFVFVFVLVFTISYLIEPKNFVYTIWTSFLLSSNITIYIQYSEFERLNQILNHPRVYQLYLLLLQTWTYASFNPIYSLFF